MFYMKLEQMSARQFEKQLGYELWHQRLAHASNRNILETIKCVHGLESLKKMTFETHTKCPSCMIGKATLEDFLKAKHPINKPLYQIHMDSFSSSVQSDDLLKNLTMQSYMSMLRQAIDGYME